MEELLKQLIEGQKQLFDGQKQIINRLDNLEDCLDSLEGQTRENTDMIKALLHRTEELDAKFDRLLNTTVSKDALERIETKIDILSHRILAQDGEIQLLKKAK